MLYPWPGHLGCGEDAGKGELKYEIAGFDCILDAVIAGVWEVANLCEIFRALYKLEYEFFIHEYQYFEGKN